MLTKLSSSAKPVIVFDVLGTLFHMQPLMDALTSSPEIQPAMSASHSKVFIEDWFHCAQRDFTYLSMNGSYTPIASVLKGTFPRQLALYGYPTSLADSILPMLKTLPPRPGFQSAHDLLSPLFSLVGATNGGAEMTRGFLTHALGAAGENAGEGEGKWDVWSCDSIQIAKPDPRVYKAVLEGIVHRGGKREGNWFVASHAWDLHAARKAGFRTAFVTGEEGDPLTDIYGSPEVVGADLAEIAKEIVRLEQAA